MSKIAIFKESFLISGIMCFDGCGNTIQELLRSCISECIADNILPTDASLTFDAEPHGLGIHKLIISIESEQDDFVVLGNLHAILASKIKEDIVFDVLDNSDESYHKKFKWTNWINILINLIAISIVIACIFLFPSSLLLTVGLISISFLTTAFTAREYLLAFFRNLRTKKLSNMATTISLGWFLSLAHTIFHVISMPLMASFSMIFMGFIMPLMLIICINSMDEIKRLVLERSKKIQLTGMKALFPQMSEKYRCYKLSEEEHAILSSQYASTKLAIVDEHKNESCAIIKDIVDTCDVQYVSKNLLKAGMLIEVKAGECFPVDCILVHGNTVIDASLLTGESQQSMQLSQIIPAGAINLSHAVTVYAVNNPYNSTVNSLLFRSNRVRNIIVSATATPKFVYFYAALVLVGIVVSILVPAVLGVITVPLVMQNVIGILFSLCPCTIALAHEMPKLISIHHRSNKGIHLRDESLSHENSDKIHTVFFDKTGTLTTGDSVVESSDIALDSPLWQRIYLLEKTYGRAHPLAKAIQEYYLSKIKEKLIFDEVKDCQIDTKNRGFTASAQGKILQIGSYEYLKSNNVILPELDNAKMEQGCSAVCVAEDGRYQGVIYIQHQARPGVFAELTRLKLKGIKIIMLTGDNDLSARGFNQQIHSIFDEDNIHAGKTPQDKESFLNEFMNTPGINPKGVWFCGDGLNDAPCCRLVSEKGGVSCSMNSHDKSAFFTDISLNGSLDYLFKHNQLNSSLRQNIEQNKGILIYSIVAFLAFIISFSIVGIAVSPLISMAIMLSTTGFILFNSYREQLVIDNALDKFTSWSKKLLSSNVSLGLLLGASSMFICGILIATISTGGLALPIIAFSVSVLAALSSVCILSAIILSSSFVIILTIALLFEQKITIDEVSPDRMVGIAARAHQNSPCGYGGHVAIAPLPTLRSVQDSVVLACDNDADVPSIFNGQGLTNFYR